jgi:hypothetical protein
VHDDDDDDDDDDDKMDMQISALSVFTKAELALCWLAHAGKSVDLIPKPVIT